MRAKEEKRGERCKLDILLMSGWIRIPKLMFRFSGRQRAEKKRETAKTFSLTPYTSCSTRGYQ